ncbi:hypothetical protein TNCV_3822561 [Trichonephila clavipes]|nr:hypothetical protein TNCV_3822561 [Trichonephila clavipes]
MLANKSVTKVPPTHSFSLIESILSLLSKNLSNHNEENEARTFQSVQEGNLNIKHLPRLLERDWELPGSSDYSLRTPALVQ